MNNASGLGTCRWSFLIAAALMVGGVLGMLVVLPANTRAATLYVGGGGPGNFTTIQSAIDAASSGDTVFVFGGVYHERISIPKTLSLVGEDRDATVIEGGHLGIVVRVTADWVNVTGVTVTNGSGGREEGAIELAAVRGARIAGNNVSDNWRCGIHLVGSSDAVIENNRLWSNLDPFGAGILLTTSNGNRILNNTMTDGADGVALVSSDGNVVAGNNASTNWDYGISLSESNDNRIENNSLFDNWGRGILVLSSERNAIRNNTLIQNYQGIELDSSSNNTVEENLLNSTWDYGIQLRYTSRNRISGNTIVSTYSDGVLVSSASAERIDNNTFRGSLYADVDLGAAVGITLADNVMTRGVMMSYFSGGGLGYWNTHDIPASNLVNDRPVLYWRNTTGGVVPGGVGQVILANATNAVVGNLSFEGVVVGVETGFSLGTTVSNVSGQGNLYGVLLVASRDSIVENVSFANATWYGVALQSSDANTVRNGTFLGARSMGLGIMSSFRNTIDSVNASRGDSTGLSMTDSGENLVSHSTFAQNALIGAYLRNSRNNTISQCVIANNTRDGLRLVADSFNNTILENAIAGNAGVGVNISNSDANHVYHNNLVGNGRQALDDRASAWDDDYPSGGNYWSDYTGADLFRGPNQDVPGSDGIGDTPYVIDTDSVDRYPLMGPFDPRGGRFPGLPQARAAVLTGVGLADVEVSWNLSSDDGGGEGDVAGYEVWSGLSYDPTGASYGLLASVAPGTTSYIHVGAGHGNAMAYFYQVRAVERGTGRAAASLVQAGKQARALTPGWQLLSVPLLQSDNSTSAVLRTLSFDIARTYRAADSADPWKVYLVGHTGDLDNLEWGDGLWIRVAAPGNLTVAGLVVAAPEFILRPAWNLVAFAAPIPEALGVSLAEVPGVVRVEAFDPGSPDPYGLRLANPAETLIPGAAYWIYIAGSGGSWIQG